MRVLVCGIVSTIGQMWVPHWRNLKDIFYYGKDSRVIVTHVFLCELKVLWIAEWKDLVKCFNACMLIMSPNIFKSSFLNRSYILFHFTSVESVNSTLCQCYFFSDTDVKWNVILSYCETSTLNEPQKVTLNTIRLQLPQMCSTIIPEPQSNFVSLYD